MKKFTAIFLILCIVSNLWLFSATTIDDLSYENRQFYISNALSIETKENINVSGGAYDFGNLGGYIPSYAYGESTTEWIPYYGPMQISRADFFDITGYKDFAEFEREIERKNKVYRTVGWSLLGSGLGLMLGGLLWNVADEYGTGLGASILMGGGILVSCVSIPFFFLETKSNISISFAVGIANNYNQKLLDSFNTDIN